MNEIYISISITVYGEGFAARCSISQSIGDEPLETRKLELNDALRMMWELKLAGGTKETNINYLDRDIVTRSVYLFLPY